MNNLKNFVGGVTNAQRTGRTAYVEPSGNENVETYAFSRQSMLGVAAYDYNTVSPYATKDSTASSYVSSSVQNYNYSSLPQTINLNVDDVFKDNKTNTRENNDPVQVILQIENFYNETEQDINQLVKEISYLMSKKKRF